MVKTLWSMEAQLQICWANLSISSTWMLVSGAISATIFSKSMSFFLPFCSYALQAPPQSRMISSLRIFYHRDTEMASGDFHAGTDCRATTTNRPFSV